MADDKLLEIPQYGAASITSPKQYVDYIIAKKKIRLPPVPEYCFIIYSQSLMAQVLARYPHQMVDIGSRNPTKIYFCTTAKGKAFGIIGEQLGASMSVVVLEELIALGFSRFIAAGTTGHPCKTGKQKLNIGDFVLVDEALVFEGTSTHYRPGTELASAGRQLCNLAADTLEALGARFHRGRIATTDALYRETAAFIDKVIELEAVAVDMETSALYTVAEFHNKQICAVLYISDIVKIDASWETEILSEDMDLSEALFINFINNIVSRD